MEVISTPAGDDRQRGIFSERVVAGFKRRRNILVVDDNKDIRDILSVLLHEEGTVYTAVNGLDALAQCAGNHFDVVVSDIEMPVMNGIELYKQVPLSYRDVFLFFSGTVNEEYISYAAANNLMLLRKPADMIKLQHVVRRKLRESFPDSATH